MSGADDHEKRSRSALRGLVAGSARLGRRVYRPALELGRLVVEKTPDLAGRGVAFAGRSARWLITGDSAAPLAFDQVLRQELEAVRRLRFRRRADVGDRLRRIRKLRSGGRTRERAAELATLEYETFSEEHHSVGVSRADAASGGDLEREAHRERLAGLAFSGGGLRSATFQLGVLSALARTRLLRRFDYLSTVSGGGYVGSWLVAWIQRWGRTAAEQGLESETDAAPPGLSASPVHFLRAYSNYLTPKRGLASLDAWMAAATYMRNLTLNFTILALAAAGVLMVPRLAVAATATGAGALGFQDPYLLAASAVLVAGALIVIAWNLDPAVANVVRPFAQTRVLLRVVVAPLFLAGVLVAVWMAGTRPEVLAARGELFAPGEPAGYFLQALAEGEPFSWIAAGALAYLGSWLFAALIWWGYWIVRSLRDRRWSRRRWRSELNQWLVAVLMALLSGAVGGAGLWWVGAALDRAAWRVGFAPGRALPGALVSVPEPIVEITSEVWIGTLTWGPPAVVGVVVLTGIFHIGLMGWVFPERNRQWWSRLGGWLAILCLGWLALFTITFFGPPLLEWLRQRSLVSFGGVGVGWLAATVAGILAVRREGGDRTLRQAALGIVARAAPFVFVLGLLSALSLGVYRAIPPAVALMSRTTWASGTPLDAGEAPIGADFGEQVSLSLRWTAGALTGRMEELAVILALILAALAFLSWRVDINQFSMHLFYRNRLIRPFLGATRKRTPVPFTGFDEADDLPLQDLDPGEGRGDLYDGPLPILNTSVNFSAGEELAWQDRRSSSFVFTPLHYGFYPSSAQAAASRSAYAGGARPIPGAYRPIAGANLDRGVSLGTAMAISGAAANPQMGQRSTSALAFLMTVFNLRLGWWMGNPAHRAARAWKKPSPRFGLLALLSELLGNSSAGWKHVNLSDGGFFDNLGIYELVRRRCRLILACDAEADPELHFSGLGNAIRRCRSDFGIEIEIDVEPIRRRSAAGASRWHCAIGTIHYPSAEGGTKGTLVYLKASLTGDEPSDLRNYAQRHPGFPHQSTADQWFDEAQFESYRKLGYHVAMSCLADGVLGPDNRVIETDLERIVQTWRQRWHPPLAASEGAFTRHSTTLGELFERQRGSPRLRFLDSQIYPEWSALTTGRPSIAPPAWLPRDEEEIREGFYFCNSLIQLMENVYIDVRLEDEHDHPDNRGWMNLFKHWSWSGMFQATWAVCAGTYGQRFQSFCERRLDLRQLEGVRAVELELKPRGARKVSGDSFRRALGGRDELNFLERRMVADFLDEKGNAFDQLFALEVAIASPFPRGGTERRDLRFGCGFALLRGGRLGVFRIQDHLRKLGLGRRALLALVREHGLASRPMWSDDADRVRVPAAWAPAFGAWGKVEELLTSAVLERRAEGA